MVISSSEGDRAGDVAEGAMETGKARIGPEVVYWRSGRLILVHGCIKGG